MNYLPPGGAYTEDQQRRWVGIHLKNLQKATKETKRSPAIPSPIFVIFVTFCSICFSSCAGWHGDVIGTGSPFDEHLTQPKLYPENSPEREREHEFNERHMDAITR